MMKPVKPGILLLTPLIALVTASLACALAEQAPIQTAAAQLRNTALAEGGKYAQTQAAILKETALIEGKEIAQTQAAILKGTTWPEGKEFIQTQAAALKATGFSELETRQAQVATLIANTPPTPWDTSWLPADRKSVAVAIDRIINGTGLSGQGAALFEDSLAFGINPAFILAMLRKESLFAFPGTLAFQNNNPGNLPATGACKGLPAGSKCYGLYGETSTDGHYGVYPGMPDGLHAFFMYLTYEYKAGTASNCADIACIANGFCPAPGCDTNDYADQVTQWTKDYQAQILSP